jgi:hypothetical protein
MHTRFITSVAAGLAGAFVVVASQAFASGTAAWIAFGIGLGILVLSAVPALFGERRASGLLLDGIAGIVALWTVVASVVFSGNVVRWLSFSEGVGFAALALGGLVLNQVRLSRRARLTAPVAVEPVVAESTGTGRPSSVAA